MANQFSTTFKDTSGKPAKFWPFIGPHGVWLADGQTSVQPGGPYDYIRKIDSRGRNALDLALAAGTLTIVSTPVPVYTDQNTGTPQVLSIAAGTVEAIDPAWGVNPADATVALASSTPANGALSVAANATVSVTFTASVTGTTFAVKQGTSTVAGSTTGSGTTWTFTPSANLTGGAVYDVTVSGATTAAGVVAPTASFSFSVAPQVSSITPANGATAVATSTTVAVVFNEPVSGAVISLSQGGTAVAGTLAMSNGGKTATFTPSAALTAAKTYAVSVTGGTDVGKNVMATYSSSFST